MPSAWDQVLTDHYQAQVIWDGPSGLPTDQLVTTWMFRNDNVLDRDGMLNAVETALSNFWGNPGDSLTNPITQFIPAELTAPRLKIFDMGTTPPRVPEELVMSSVVPSGSQSPLPREVAVCCSFNVGGPGPRNRGRTFLGPWTIAALADQGTFGYSSVSPDLIATIAERAEDMATNPSLECTWVLWSRANAATYVVTGGFVDDAFDTQRSRGKAPSTRTSWGVPIASGVGGDPGGDPSTSAV